ncbi:hypothetical protein BU14_0441s0012 [Porphyra umbilicalis]|uniref:Transcription initiation factor IIE subunit alpha N-terminal domain-containing protein n=1 Tax=Porphyra umbilicalis TaxID=2786 RepID=A0A1X6NVK3_PORUM|nr:hypothetical protein BU14_0441s0012 [Porphyra umbilicalis]|eukprot:OSX72403.1 hypothetical protein BU14_0441s0012 [Porphyra umbilicalis]
MPDKEPEKAIPVPTVVKDFVRMVVRAFGTPVFIVVVDAILREGYVRVESMSSTLKMPAKELRTTLKQLCEAGFARSERRSLRRENTGNPLAPARSVQSEIFFVPHTEILDSFRYRLDVIKEDLDAKIGNELEHQMYRCPRCRALYTALDATSRTDSVTGRFKCDAEIGRNVECGTLMEEEDTAGERAALVALKERFDAEVRPLREQFAACEGVPMPDHPLDGLDELELGRVVTDAEIHGPDGGLTGDYGGVAGDTEQKIDVEIESSAPDEQARRDALAAKNADAIPDGPSWFKKGTKRGAEDEEEEPAAGWEEGGKGGGEGGGAAAGDDDAPDDYAAQYMAQMMKQAAAAAGNKGSGSGGGGS